MHSRDSHLTYERNSTNIWNSTEKIIYTYNGSTYTNYLGNYWSDSRITERKAQGHTKWLTDFGRIK